VDDRSSTNTFEKHFFYVEKYQILGQWD